MNKATKLLVAVLLVLFLAPAAYAQVTDNGYNAYGQAIQTKNMPAGVVNEPGSQLIYLLDTGVDAKGMYSGHEDYASKSVYDLSAGDIDMSAFRNFISVTNTNPTEAVTVHFRFLSSYRYLVWDGSDWVWSYNCEDLLDFLVVLTCNDTMLIDPFDYDIPGTTLNTKARFFGSASAPGILKGIPARTFDDGRFFLFVTASADVAQIVGSPSSATNLTGGAHPEGGDIIADWRYPRELVPENSDGDAIGFDDCDDADTLYMGWRTGIIDNNLHILNATAVSFNYLTGFGTIAIPTAYLEGAANDAAYGVVAYARPAVDLGADGNSSPITGGPDGDGPPAPKWVMLTGTELVPWSQKATTTAGGYATSYALRNEAHGGDTLSRGGVITSWGGSLGWTLFPIDGPTYDGMLPENQFLFFVSMLDDYNGSNNAKKSSSIPESDWSYGIDGAKTNYQVLVYNNDEELLQFDDPEIPVSPPPQFIQISINISVRCFDAFDANYNTEFDDFSIADLQSLGGQDLIDFLAVPVPVNDEKGPGWIKFVRNQSVEAEEHDGSAGTFLTIAQQVYLFEGFGTSWWSPTVAYTPLPR
ncbi:MAG: hypothetical protein JSU96_09565 [Acidobacteriota bacterium]|nr:MAG: hypothetical protein JSU96_09565 [Acidobacteriota bacterium]